MRSLPQELAPTFTTGAALALGVHPRDLYTWRDHGLCVELSRGVYRRADAPPATWPDLLAVSYRNPRAIVCCVSAAQVHDLTDEMPPKVQIAVGKSRRPPKITMPPTMVFRFEEKNVETGVTQVEVAPQEFVRIYDPARTVVDLMRLRHRFGESLAYSVLKRYTTSTFANPALVLRYALALDTYQPTRLALDIARAL
jgi:predicted transcriptional regulator of viral defense system